MLVILKSLSFGSRKRLSRGYDQQEKKEGTLETSTLGRSKTSKRSVPDNGGARVPVMVNSNPFLSSLGQVIHKNLCFLCLDKEVKQNFAPAPLASFHSVRTLRSQSLSSGRETSWVKEM